MGRPFQQTSVWARSYYDELLSPRKNSSGLPRDLLPVNGFGFWFAAGRIAFRIWKLFTRAPARDEPCPPHRRIFQPWIPSGKKVAGFFENFSPFS
jgi:hypothetical protein